MEILIATYDGPDFNQAIEEARRRHPNHIGAVIAIPRGLERQGFFGSLTRGAGGEFFGHYKKGPYPAKS